MIRPNAGIVKPLGVGARLFLGYYLGRLFSSVQPGKLAQQKKPRICRGSFNLSLGDDQ
jgi:hypothetical protein